MGGPTTADLKQLELRAKRAARTAALGAVQEALNPEPTSQRVAIPVDRRITVPCQCGAEHWRVEQIAQVFSDKEDGTALDAPTRPRFQCVQCGLFLEMKIKDVEGKAVAEASFQDLVGMGPSRRFLFAVGAAVDEWFGTEREPEATQLMGAVLAKLGFGIEGNKNLEGPVTETEKSDMELLADSVGSTD